METELWEYGCKLLVVLTLNKAEINRNKKKRKKNTVAKELLWIEAVDWWFSQAKFYILGYFFWIVNFQVVF